MLPRFHLEFLHWGTSNRAAKIKYNTNLARLLLKQIYSLIIIDWEVLNNMGCTKEIEEMMEIKVYEMGGDEEIFTSENLSMPIYAMKFMQLMSLMRRGLRNDDHFNVNQYWSEISSENGLILPRSYAGTIRKPILRVLQKMITYGLCQRTTGYDKRKGVGIQRDSMICCGQLITKIARRAHLLTGEVVNGLSAPIYYRSSDTTTLRELINSNRRLIAEDPAPGDPRVAIPRPPHHSISDLYNRMGRIEIRHGELERMARRQSYHYDRYARLFEYMVGHYDVL
ncbi:hypothetical protein Tco_1434005 [Tanacetum coccineum]